MYWTAFLSIWGPLWWARVLFLGDTSDTAAWGDLAFITVIVYLVDAGWCVIG